MNNKVLIVDDNKSILTALELLLETQNYITEIFTSPDAAFNRFNNTEFDVVLLDMNFKAGINSGNEGLFWLKKFKKKDPNISIVMITAYSDVDIIVNAIKMGAFDFISKPWKNDKLLATVHAAVSHTSSCREVTLLKTQGKALISELNKKSEIVGSSSAIKEVFKLIEKVAVTDANVLLMGENGTGKEVFAQEIHRLSNRKNKPLVTVDMGSLPETLFESELFGHKKGAYTDAREDRAGKFEVASGGTLFLDECANIPLHMQSKLLSALQNRTITRIGENIQRKVDIRLICATNADLEAMVTDGTFREDLLYRINTIVIELPPLRERKGDVNILSDFFLRKFASKYGKSDLKISPQAKIKLNEYDWPGNVRELMHTIEKAVILAENKELGTHDFMLRGSLRQSKIKKIVTLEEMESSLIEAAIIKNSGNLTATAADLGITRQTLYNKMKKLDSEGLSFILKK